MPPFVRIAVPSLLAIVLLILAWPGGDRPAPWPGIPAVGKDASGAKSPRARVRQRLLEMVDENGAIPDDAVMKAAAQRQATAMLEFGNAGLDPKSWRWAGPDNIGGRCRALYIHPRNSNYLVLGSVGGGIWYSRNAGRDWKAADDFLPSLAVTSIVGHPRTPDTIYAGTGEGFGNGDAIAGAGIFKSFDLGRTWRRLSSTANSDFRFVNRLAMSSGSSFVLLAATSRGIRRSTNQGLSWQRSTVTPTLFVAWAPGSSTNAVASGRGFASYSTDAGATWRRAAGLPAAGFPPTKLGRVELAYGGRTAANVVYASCQYDGKFTHIYKSVDGGRSYKIVHVTTPMLGSQGWYDNAVWVDPTNPNLVLVGGIGLWRSRNGGRSWTSIHGTHVDYHWIVADPFYDGVRNKRVYVCNDGGIYRNDDIVNTGRGGWVNLNKGLGITQYYGGDVSAFGLLYGGTQDNGTTRRVSTLSKVHTIFAGADGGECAADPSDGRYLFGETQYAGVFRSSDGGRTSVDIARPNKPGGLKDAGNSATAPFLAPLAIDRRNPNRLWVGAKNLWRCDNAKSPVPVWLIARPNGADGMPTAIGVSPADSRVVYVGYGRGQIYKSTNATSIAPRWTRVDNRTLPPRRVLKIVVSPIDSNHVYVSYGGFAFGNVAFSPNGGTTWTIVSGSGTTGLPAAPVRGLAVHPAAQGWIYAGTEVGVYASTDNGRTWSTTNDGPANVSIDELVLRGETLYAFTHGRGIYTAHAAPDRDPTETIARANITWLGGQALGSSVTASMDANGRFVAFHSTAANLVLGDANRASDVFVRDRQEGTTRLLSAAPSRRSGNSSSKNACIARDGRFVAFESLASDLVPGDTNGRVDIFVRDLQNGTIERVSMAGAPDWLPGQANGNCSVPSIDAVGRYVVFSSFATNLVSGDTNRARDVFLRDPIRERCERISVGAGLAQANSYSFNSRRAISRDGTAVVFTSAATNLVPGDTNNALDVFVRDRRFGRTVRVSVSSSGAQGNGHSSNAQISDDGRYVVFESTSSNLVPGDTNRASDIFLHDRVTRRTTLVTRVGSQSANGRSYGPTISADGQWIAFTSAATNLVSGDTNGKDDVFVYRRGGTVFERVNVDVAGRQANAPAYVAEIAGGGEFVSFHSTADNLVPGDTNRASDVFVVRRRGAGLVFPLAAASAEGNTVWSFPFARPMRLQQAVRESRGRVLDVRRISFRRDGATPSNSAYGSRVVTLEARMCEAEIDGLSTRFAANPVISTLAIRRKPFRLPDWTNRPNGLAGFDAVLPLDQPYRHSGRRNLMVDFTVFSVSRRSTYPVDADSRRLRATSSRSVLGAGCRTGNGVFALGGYYTSDGRASELRLDVKGAPSGATVSLFLGATDPNLTPPGFCSAIRTDGAITATLGTASATGALLGRIPGVPWEPAHRGVVLYAQVGALDLGRQGFPLALSNGLRLKLPTSDPGPALRSVFAFSPSAVTGQVVDHGAVLRVDG